MALRRRRGGAAARSGTVRPGRGYRRACTEDPDGPRDLYAMLDGRGITLGPSFRGITQLFRGDNEALVQVVLPAGVAPVAPLHPAQLDACFQALGATFKGDGQGGAFLPLAVDHAVLYRPFAGPLWAHARVRNDAGTSGDVATGDIVLFDDAGETIAAITGLTIKRVGAATLTHDPSDRWTYAVEWIAEPNVAIELPPLARLGSAALTAGAAAAPADEPGLADGLEQLAAAYAARALNEVRLSPPRRLRRVKPGFLPICRRWRRAPRPCPNRWPRRSSRALANAWKSISPVAAAGP